MTTVSVMGKSKDCPQIISVPTAQPFMVIYPMADLTETMNTLLLIQPEIVAFKLVRLNEENVLVTGILPSGANGNTTIISDPCPWVCDNR